jgi:hypothetical protein
MLKIVATKKTAFQRPAIYSIFYYLQIWNGFLTLHPRSQFPHRPLRMCIRLRRLEMGPAGQVRPGR